MRHSTNPFENDNVATSGGWESEVERNHHDIGDVIADGKDDASSSPSKLSALFPAWLSSWMTISTPPHNLPEEDDDDSILYHNCVDANPSSSSPGGGEWTSLLAKTAHHRNIASRPLSPLHRREKFYNATSTTTVSNTVRDLGEELSQHQSIASPYGQALATWLSPYADSAKRAGRKVFYFSKEFDIDTEKDERADENSVLNEVVPVRSENKVRFHTDYESTGNEEENPRSSRNVGCLNRVSSSPALMTNFPDERWGNARETDLAKRNHGTIFLKDIDIQGENNDSEDGTVIHPWTKLILLEELGTAWSWLVLLLPYAFMILAVILDGNATLKNTLVGPLLGNRSCAEMVQGSVPTPFDESVKGYFPVPFRFIDGNVSGSNRTTLSGSCTYPFELREGVGLLSRGKSFGSNSRSSSTRISIIDARYRYFMSHGYAFTSGVIADVPPTSQSLSGSVKFTKLSSKTVALVARGSVLVSAILFQRQRTENEVANPSAKEWSPVLILSSKRLEMVCKLNGNHIEEEHEASTWNCTSRRVLNAFFSLPNAAVLTGEDLRVDILFSHRKVYNLLKQDIWINERGGVMSADDDYVIHDFNENSFLSPADKILSTADVSHPQDLLAELSTKSMYMLQHESIAFNNVVEATRIFALTITVMFLCYWLRSVMRIDGVQDLGTENENDTLSAREGLRSLMRKMSCSLTCCCKRSNLQTFFWWEDPWFMFPERRYLLLLICCLVALQNPLLVYAFFHPLLYSSAKFRFAADSLAGLSVHGILFLWLCLVHGLRYHTADISRRRLSQHRRILELRTCIDDAMIHRHNSPAKIQDNQWEGVSWYYQQFGDIDGSGAAYSMALRLKHDVNSDSFLEFLVPKITLLVIGITSSITAAATRFPFSESTAMSERVELNPDRVGRGSKVYVVSSIVQIVVIQLWCILIVYTSFVTGERLRREPFLSTRPSQLAFRVLSSILLLGTAFSISLLYFHSLSSIDRDSTSNNIPSETEVLYDTSFGGIDNELSWDSKADILFGIIRHASTVVPYIGTASNIGPGKILYATACSLVVAYIFLPSSHFYPARKEPRKADGITMRPDSMSDLDKRLQGKDKRFVVALARNTHTWRVFPLPTRSHGLLSQHTLKETLHIIGTFQLDGRFNNHKLKFGRGAIYKGRYVPVFCVEIACWLLEASWQAYYSPSEYSLNNWAPGRMRLDSIGLKLEHAITDNETDTHAFVASNVSEQVEGEEDSIIVVAFRGSASLSNIKTDLNHWQVPLPEKIISDIPAFNIRPGMPIAADKTQWDKNENESSLQSINDILRGPSGKYESWPTTSGESTDQNDLDQSALIPNVSSGAKAILRATPMARQALPCVHGGFLQNYSNIRKEIIEAIVPVLKRQIDKSVERSRHGGSFDAAQPLTLPKIYCSGHSMGGALAQLLALDLASNCEIVIEQPISEDETSITNSNEAPSKQSQSSLDENEEVEESSDTGDIYWLGQKLPHRNTPAKKIRLRPPIAVYTYGQSRLGNLAFKTIYKRRVPHTFRVVTEGDAITTIPTVGPFCGGVYRHAGLEVLLEEGCTGNILVGPTVVETLLRFTKVRTSMAAHSMERYRESLESALGREELKEYYRGHGGKVRHDNQGAHSGNGLPSWVTSVKRSHDV